jgi:hypothetical protein
VVPKRNPFKPSAGSTPPYLVGRQDQIDAVAEGFDDGPGAPGRLAIFTGARGVGKTVMLNAVGDLATERGWLTIDETATSHLMDRLDEQVTHLIDAVTSPAKRKVTGVTLPLKLGGITTTLVPDPEASLRRKINTLLDILEAHDSGLLITIDEAHAEEPDLREFAAIAQHFVREERDLVLVLAGLPSAVADILRDKTKVLTFLRRADKHELGDVDVGEVRDALVATIEDNGRQIAPEAADAAAEATLGYPFLIQLVGYHVWRMAPAEPLIDLSMVEKGVAAARRRLGSLVHETALADLSDQDRTFLIAMSVDDGPSRMSDIRRRMGGIIPQHGNTYRERLIRAGVIEQVRHGVVDFALPYLREYLREHAATYGLVPEA